MTNNFRGSKSVGWKPFMDVKDSGIPKIEVDFTVDPNAKLPEGQEERLLNTGQWNSPVHLKEVAKEILNAADALAEDFEQIKVEFDQGFHSKNEVLEEREERVNAIDSMQNTYSVICNRISELEKGDTSKESEPSVGELDADYDR